MARCAEVWHPRPVDSKRRGRHVLVVLGLLLGARATAACSGTRALEDFARDAAAPERAAQTTPTDGDDAGAEAAAPSASDAGDLGDAAAPGDAATDAPRSRFACKELGPSAFRPYWLQVIPTDAGPTIKDWGATPKGLLGQNPMATRAECDEARAAANEAAGVICSRTGLDGWKPTLYTGTVPGRADFGYLGGSSILVFDDCLKATRGSSDAGVCFWGGSEWYVAPIDREGVNAGPFATVDACVAATR